jgi:hypothetical protein
MLGTPGTGRDSKARERLPNRRGHELLDSESGGIRCTVGAVRFPDGRLADARPPQGHSLCSSTLCEPK